MQEKSSPECQPKLFRCWFSKTLIRMATFDKNIIWEKIIEKLIYFIHLLKLICMNNLERHCLPEKPSSTRQDNLKMSPLEINFSDNKFLSRNSWVVNIWRVITLMKAIALWNLYCSHINAYTMHFSIVGFLLLMLIYTKHFWIRPSTWLQQAKLYEVKSFTAIYFFPQ